MFISHVYFYLFQIIFTFQCSFSAVLNIITQDSERLFYLIISPKVPPPCLGGREDLTGARYYTDIVLKTKDYYYRIILQPLLLLLFSLSQT